MPRCSSNLGIAVAKLIGFFFTSSTSMLAESIHSLADTGNQGLLFLGGRAARQAPDTEHPFGYGHVRYFWAFVVALVLFSLGGLFSIFEGIEKLYAPVELESPAWALGILGVAVVLESLSLRTAVREARPLLGGASWWGFIRRSKSPELPVVLLEDTGALIGLMFAVVGVSLSALTGDPRWDALGSLAIGILLVAIAWVLTVETKSLLIGEAAAPRQVEAITRALAASVEVQRVIHLRTQHVGPDEILVAAKVAYPGHLSMRSLASAIDEAERNVRAAVPTARWIFLEPDIDRGVADDPSASPEA